MHFKAAARNYVMKNLIFTMEIVETGTTKNVCPYHHQIKHPIHVFHILVHIAVNLLNSYFRFAITSQPLPMTQNVPEV